ncbi:MAG: F0F1 ATP synthase subunit delta, partial [Candidatus Aminicenantales bacterium]
IGTVTVEAFSAVPLSQAQQTRLRRALESREGRPVFLNFSRDPELMGGLAMRKGHVIYDLTIRGELSRLRDILAEK